uniref:Ribosomal protein S3 n=1 Tax=Piridium sociabile TaxID=2570542 RepID=A0A5B9XVT5_9ALVE|nr:ribosomal protein S3 [Piridium sociabile]
MGRKVNPINLRAKYINNISNKWFTSNIKNKNIYISKLQEDLIIYYLSNSLYNIFDILDVTVIRDSFNKCLITIVIPSPLYINNITTIFNEIDLLNKIQSLDNNELMLSIKKLVLWLFNINNYIKNTEIFLKLHLSKIPFYEPLFLFQLVKGGYIKNIPFRRSFKFWSNYIFDSNYGQLKICGIKMQIKGRLNGEERKSKEEYKIGDVSLSSLNKNIKYLCKEINTKYGILGFKIWIVFSSINNEY